MSDNPFQIAGENKQMGSSVSLDENSNSMDLKQKIEALIHSSPLFLFMKGSPEAPQCGFSANVVSILNHLDLEFKSFDILTDMDIRQGVKEFSNWPTYPQLYLKGKLLGGNDIITEMFQNGELEQVLKS